MCPQMVAIRNLNLYQEHCDKASRLRRARSVSHLANHEAFTQETRAWPNVPACYCLCWIKALFHHCITFECFLLRASRRKRNLHFRIHIPSADLLLCPRLWFITSLGGINSVALRRCHLGMGIWIHGVAPKVKMTRKIHEVQVLP